MYLLAVAMHVVAILGLATLAYVEHCDAERARKEAEAWRSAYNALVIKLRAATQPKETVVAQQFWAPKDRYSE